MAYQYKEEGNQLFKGGKLDQALAKYSRVSLFTKTLLPIENKEMAQFMSAKVDLSGYSNRIKLRKRVLAEKKSIK